MLTIVICLVAVLAFANGANDNSKGVATLVGYGAATPRQALLWATITTALGAGLSFWLAGGLIAAFKAKLFLPGTPLDVHFFIAVLVAAVGWIAFATITGMPVSTTHAIIGGLIGAGLVAFGHNQIVWAFLATAVAVPLVLSPLVSLLLVYVLAWPVVALSRRTAGRCLCVVECPVVDTALNAAVAVSVPTLTTGTMAECAAASPSITMTGSKAANAVHWASGGLVGLARGWNDAPKIAALSIVGLTAAKVQNPAAVGFIIVTLAMALGGYLAGRKVLDTLATRLTPLPLAESLTASLITAALVSAASWAGMPVSTTHVSTGAIVGAGLRNNPSAVRWGKVTEIVLSWLVTLPVAALIAAGTMWCLGR
ncbi:MAG: inorganic phosphate transporter [Phycisphaerae bacterium]